MGRSNAVRLADVRAAFRIVGDCRGAGRDPGGWLAVAADGFRTLADADVILAVVTPPGPFASFADALAGHDSGWESAAARAVGLGYVAGGTYTASPDYRAYRALGRPGLVAARRRLVADRDWYRTTHFQVHWRPAGVDHYVVAIGGSPAATLLVNVGRRVGRPALARRQARLAGLLRTELSRLLGAGLATGHPDPAGHLPPRLRQVLACLHDGDGEKQVAARLSLSRHTVHDYVKELHRRFGAASRGELLARTRPGRPPSNIPT
jgi:DNA-binding CsgD family transcriptional regulator